MKRRQLFIVFAFLTAILQMLWSQELQPDQILRLKAVYNPVLSPDGRYCLYYLRVPPEEGSGSRSFSSELHVYDFRKGEDRLFSSSPVRDAQWTADGKYLSFLKNDPETKKTQVFKMPVDGGEAYPITRSGKSIVLHRWSPDGKSLALIGREPVKYGRQSSEEDWIINEMDFSYEYLYLYDFTADTLIRISPDSLHVWDMEWSPDGRQIFFQASQIGMVDHEYMFRDLYAVEVGNKSVRQVVRHDGKMGMMKVSPDNRWMAFLGGVDLYDPAEGSLLLVPADGKMAEWKNLTAGFEGTVEDFSWLDSGSILFSAVSWNEVLLYRLEISSGKIQEIWRSDLSYYSFDYCQATGEIVFAGSHFTHPSELFVMSLKSRKPRKLTDSNPDIKNIRFSEPEDFTWTARDGMKISGLLYKPFGFREGEKYPLVVIVHGGPESAYTKGWNNSYSTFPQLLTQRGALVFMPNYRGSTGRGVDFAKADQGDMMGVDFNDILDGVDALIAKGWADGERVGITGGSYGGYASAWAATKYTDRFAASVMFVGISNQISKIGTTDTWYENALVHWKGWPYDDDFQLAWDRSPLKYARQARTPILILHGMKDTRVPTSQSVELYRALKHFGKAPVKLVLYPDEGHGNRLYHHQKHYLYEALHWLDTYLFNKK